MLQRDPWRKALNGKQMAKMVKISQRLEHKDYPSRDVTTKAFLRQKEADLLFKRGFSHDASRDLDQAQIQVKKFLEHVQRPIENERAQSKQMDLGL